MAHKFHSVRRPFHNSARRGVTAKLLCAACASAAVSIAVNRSASAGAVQWNNPAGGTWSDDANWSPALAPVSSDDVSFALAAASQYAVTASADASVNSLSVATDNVSLGFGSSTLSIATTLTQAPIAGQISQLALSSGTLVVSSNMSVGLSGSGSFTQTSSSNTIGTSAANANLIIGSQSNAFGSYTLGDDSASLVVNGNETIALSATRIDPLTMAGSAFTQSGGTHTISGTLTIATNTSANGVYNLQKGTLTIGSIASPTFVQVGQSGIAAFNQTGGTASIIGALTLGYNGSASGTYTLSGTGSLTVGTDERIAQTGTGVFNQTGGTHTIQGNFWIAYFAGTGTYNLSGGTLNAISEEYVGRQGTGNFFQTGGTNIISGQNDGAFGVGEFETSHGYYTMSDGILNANIEQIGLLGVGSFIQTGGTHTVSGAFGVAVNTSASGSFSLQGGSLSALTEDVGQKGAGTFTQTSGTNTITNALTIATNANSSGSYTLQGGTLTAGSIAVLTVGTFNLNGGTLSTPSITCTSGTMNVAATGSINSASLSLGTAGHVVLVSVAAPSAPNIQTVASLSIDSTSRLDIGNNEMIISSAAVPAIKALIAAGYNAGAWNAAHGIISSAAQTDAHHGVGYIPANAGSGVEIRYALYGDTNLDGSVNFSDLVALAQNYNSTTSTWATGDFNYDATTNFADLVALAQNFNGVLTPGENGLSPSFAADWKLAQSEIAAIPEPTSIALLAISATGLLQRKRRGFSEAS